MDERIEIIKKWLGTGSINVFGMPFSGKDTVGIHLAEVLGAKFLSSGLILRAAEKEDKEIENEMATGQLVNTDKFRSIVLPYLAKSELSDFPLILSSVGRWEGEEYDVIEKAEEAGHPIKAVIVLNLSEAEVKTRWRASHSLQDRGERLDDKEEAILDIRIREFNEKTAPVIETYQKRGLIAPVKAAGTREEVFTNVIDVLMHFALNNDREIPLTDDEFTDEGAGTVNIHDEPDEVDPGEEEEEPTHESDDYEKEEE
ncbi:nucleoside monophosphate kinase [Candidatus Saccharibacteria bacterium]|nr:nucleoside monophosphate kinase [Candidatus Saccharibacteria bacterium]